MTTGRYIDITLSLQSGMPVWPGDPAVSMEPNSGFAAGDSCAVTIFRFGSHTGTHIDPPRHCFEDGVTLDELPFETLIGPCFVATMEHVKGTVDHDDLESAGIPSATERLLLKTANSNRWEDPLHPFDPGFIDLSIDGARWLIRHGIRLIGIDYLSIEGPADESLPVHRMLLGAGVVVLEGLDLRKAASGEYNLLCLPMRAANGDGAPVRAVLTPLVSD